MPKLLQDKTCDWKLTLIEIQEKLRKDKPLTMPESRWLAWELPEILQKKNNE